MPNRAWPVLLLLGCGRESQTPATPAAMFRGDAAHTGVSTARFFGGQGGIRWQIQTGGVVRSSPTVAGNRLYVGSGDGGLYAIDRATGTIAWRAEASGPVHASPAVTGGSVICATLGGRIFAVDQESGSIRWSFSSGPALPLNTSPAGGWDVIASSPVIAGGLAVIGAPDGYVYAFETSGGKLRWKVKTGGRVRATPAVSNGVVVVGSFDGRVYGLDLSTGAERWVHRTEGDTLDSSKFGFDRRAVQGSAAIADGMILVGSRDGGLYGLDAATGERRWRLSHHGSWVLGSPALSHGRAYVGSSDGHYLQAVDPVSGRELWHLETESNVLSSPLLVGDALVVGTYRTDATWGDLIAVDPASGAVRWRLRLDGAIMSSPTAADGELYVGTEGGSIVAVTETNTLVPHLAVFFDSSLAGQASVPGAALAAAYFSDLGYEVLNAGALARFLEARIKDAVPSAVVFALDVVPGSVAPTLTDTVLIRHYLESGGKVVWLGSPIGSVFRDSKGVITENEFARTGKLLGLDPRSFDYNEYPAQPTEAGRRWGLTDWFRGDYPIDTAAVSMALAVDEAGQTTAWVRAYRADRPGSGYVQLWGFGATIERLPFVRAAAEYGLLRTSQ